MPLLLRQPGPPHPDPNASTAVGPARRGIADGKKHIPDPAPRSTAFHPGFPAQTGLALSSPADKGEREGLMISNLF